MIVELYQTLTPKIQIVKQAFECQEIVSNYDEVSNSYLFVLVSLYGYILDDLFGTEGMDEEYYKYIRSLNSNCSDEIIRSRFNVHQLKNIFCEDNISPLVRKISRKLSIYSLKKSLSFNIRAFNSIFLDQEGYFSFVYYSLRQPPKDVKMLNKIRKAQRFISDLYLNSDLYCFPLMSMAEQFFFLFGSHQKFAQIVFWIFSQQVIIPSLRILKKI